MGQVNADESCFDNSGLNEEMCFLNMTIPKTVPSNLCSSAYTNSFVVVVSGSLNALNAFHGVTGTKAVIWCPCRPQIAPEVLFAALG